MANLANLINYNQNDCSNYRNKNIYLEVFCKDSVVVLNGNTGIKLSDMAFVVGIIDVLVILTFIYMIVNIKISGR